MPRKKLSTTSAPARRRNAGATAPIRCR
jgi:hypothetical protein